MDKIKGKLELGGNVRRIKKYIFLLIFPCWIFYTIYDTYYDETTKDAVVSETKKIVNYVGGSPQVVYKNKDKLIVFRSEIYFNYDDIDSIKKCKEYLLKNGYTKEREDLWAKGKYEITEKSDGDCLIIKLRYIRNMVK